MDHVGKPFLVAEEVRDTGSIGYRIYPNVRLGKGVVIQDFVVIGVPPRGYEPGQLETVIGDNAVIRSHTVIYAGCRIGDNFQCGHGAFIREFTQIGDNVSVGMNVILEHHCVIGNNVRFQGQAGIAEYSVLEDDCWIGPRVTFTNVLHPTCKKAKECLKGPVIKKGAILGAGVVVNPAVVIGEKALIGSGVLVTRDVPPEKVVFGRPGRIIGDIYSLSCPYGLVEKPYFRG